MYLIRAGGHMNNSVDLIVYNMVLNHDKEKINKFIKDYTPFIIKTVSTLKGQYLDLENDEEYSVALMAFNEAMEKYNYEKGAFLNFAKIVIESRVKNYWISIKKHQHVDLDDVPVVIEDNNEDLVHEIKEFEKTLLLFDLDFETLIEVAPKHSDTRKRAISIASKTSQNKTFVNHIYEKKRLPITLMSKAYDVSIKIIKKSKVFILSTVIIFDKKLKLIQEWLK